MTQKEKEEELTNKIFFDPKEVKINNFKFRVGYTRIVLKQASLKSLWNTACV